MRFVKLTDASQTEVYVNLDLVVTMVRLDHGTRVTFVDEDTKHFLETPDEILRKPAEPVKA